MSYCVFRLAAIDCDFGSVSSIVCEVNCFLLRHPLSVINLKVLYHVDLGLIVLLIKMVRAAVASKNDDIFGQVVVRQTDFIRPAEGQHILVYKCS